MKEILPLLLPVVLLFLGFILPVGYFVFFDKDLLILNEKSKKQKNKKQKTKINQKTRPLH